MTIARLTLVAVVALASIAAVPPANNPGQHKGWLHKKVQHVPEPATATFILALAAAGGAAQITRSSIRYLRSRKR